MKRILAIVLAVALAAPLTAETRSPKIAVIDVQTVFQKSETFKKEFSKVNRELKKAQNEVEGMLLQLRRLSDELNKQKSTLSEERLTERRQEILDLRGAVRDKQKAMEELFVGSEKQVLTPYMEVLRQVSEDLAKEEGFDMVLTSDMTLFVAPLYDLTDEAIVMFEKKLEATPIQLPESATTLPESGSDK